MRYITGARLLQYFMWSVAATFVVFVVLVGSTCQQRDTPALQSASDTQYFYTVKRRLPVRVYPGFGLNPILPAGSFRTTDLSYAQAQVPFPLLLPTTLPGDLRLLHYQATFEELHDPLGASIDVTYRSGVDGVLIVITEKPDRLLAASGVLQNTGERVEEAAVDTLSVSLLYEQQYGDRPWVAQFMHCGLFYELVQVSFDDRAAKGHMLLDKDGVLAVVALTLQQRSPDCSERAAAYERLLQPGPDGTFFGGKYVTSNLEVAQRQSAFRLIVPTYLPPGFSGKYGIRGPTWGSRPQGPSQVWFTFQGQNRSIVLIESDVRESTGTLAIPGLRAAQIAGQNVGLIEDSPQGSESGPSYSIYFKQNGVSFTVFSENVSRKDIFKTVESLLEQ